MSSKSSRDLIELRMKLVGEKLVVTGNKNVRKSIEGVSKATSDTAAKQRYAERTSSRLTSSYKKLGSAAKWGLGFLGVGGVLAVKSSIAATEELAKSTSSLTRNFGFSTNVASRWAAVMHSRESDPKALSQALGTLSAKLVQAGREGGTALTPFHLLGMSQEEVAHGARDFEWGLLRVADALGEEAGGAKRSAAAKALLGKGFQLLTPLFSEGTKGLKEQLHWADKYGVTLNTTTNDGIMEMVSAQRENKVAMLGLQLSLTKALMPAIHAGDEELQKFIATLNSPHLTAEQKVRRISHQFLALENDVVKVIEQALPTIAEHAGHLGVVMAKSLWHGFRNSDVVGKLVIGAWIFHLFGGEALVKAGARRVGGKIGTSMGIGIGAGVVGAYVGYEIWESLSDRTQAELILTAEKMGTAFANFFVRAWNAANPLPFGIGDKGEFEPRQHDLTPAEAYAPPVGKGTHKGILGSGGHLTNAEKRKNYEDLWGKPPPPGPPPWPPPSRREHKMAPRVAKAPRRRELMAAPQVAQPHNGRGAQTLVIHTHFHADGKELAELITEHSLDAAALQ